MRPPACTQCKWGTGTTCEKPSNSASSKEITTKLQQMMEERTKQDVAWFAPPSEEKAQDIKKKIEDTATFQLETVSSDGNFADFKSTNDYTTQSSFSSEIPQNKRK